MSVCRYCCVFLLVKLLTGSSSGTGVIFKYVCIGDDVPIYQNIPSGNGISEISLYTNGVNRNLIGVWPIKNSVPTMFQNAYEGKVFRDESGTIWIRSVNLSDEAKYVIQYESYGSRTTSEVQIEVMVAPTKDCKPKVRRMDTSLDASLEASACGKPAVSLHWLDFNGNSFKNKTVKLPPKKEAGTYNVCIDGPALQCVNTSWDYCSKYTIGEHSRDVSICQGNRVQLFKSSNTDVDVSLYKYGANYTFIASWYRKTSIKTCSVESGYEEKVMCVKNGDIWMKDVDVSDEGKYVIYYESDGFSAESEVQIEVLVAPSRHCKPKIELIDDSILQASVEAKDCGKHVRVSWQDNHGNLYTSPTIKLPHGKEDGTYIACIEGPALTCVNSSAQWNYCSVYPTRGSNSHQSSEILVVMIPVHVILPIMLAILLGIVVQKLRKHWKKLRTNVDAKNPYTIPKTSNVVNIQDAQTSDSLLNTSDGNVEEFVSATSEGSIELQPDVANASVPLLPQSTGKEAQPCSSRDNVEKKYDYSSEADKESGPDKQQISNVECSSEDSKETKKLNNHLD